jgi:hypothetical protein
MSLLASMTSVANLMACKLSLLVSAVALHSKAVQWKCCVTAVNAARGNEELRAVKTLSDHRKGATLVPGTATFFHHKGNKRGQWGPGGLQTWLDSGSALAESWKVHYTWYGQD